MYLLVDNNNVCMFSGSNIVLDESEIKYKQWLVTNETDTLCVIGDGLVLFEVNETPTDYEELKYCYNQENGFYLNPNYTVSETQENTIPLSIEELEERMIDAEIETDLRLSMLELGLS